MTTVRVQIHQYNDPEIREFFNAHRVKFRLLGDHLFVIQTAEGDVAAGAGDWLLAGPDGEVAVERGDYARRCARMINAGRNPRRDGRRSPMQARGRSAVRRAPAMEDRVA